MKAYVGLLGTCVAVFIIITMVIGVFKGESKKAFAVSENPAWNIFFGLVYFLYWWPLEYLFHLMGTIIELYRAFPPAQGRWPFCVPILLCNDHYILLFSMEVVQVIQAQSSDLYPYCHITFRRIRILFACTISPGNA